MVKRLLLAFLCLSGVFATTAQTRGNADYNVEYSAAAKGDMQLRFSVKDYKLVDVVKNGVAYTTIEFNHGVTTEQKGFAELPMLGATLQLAASGDVELVIEEGEYQDIKLSHPLLPSRGTIYRNQNPATIPYKVAPESLVDEWYPARVAYSDDPFVFRDTRGVNVYAHPFRYNAKQQTLRVYKSVTVTLKRNTHATTNPLNVAPSVVDPSMVNAYRSLYMNYAESKFAHQLGEWGEMLVIYTQRDAQAIAPYIEWKRQKGFTVHTQQVATGTNVVNTIANAYNNNPNLLYVQLVGDWADIKSNLGTTQNAPTDPQMGCVVGNDYYPELIIGRFSGNSAADITVQVDKAIAYEKNPDMNGAWYARALNIASNEGGVGADDNEIDYEHSEVIRSNKLLPYTYTNVYTQYQPNATTNATVQYINNGLGLINYTGHGGETSWVTSSLYVNNVNTLTNNSQLPFIFSVACVVGKFHRTGGDCFAEAWLKKQNGGAVVAIMSTINQPWVPPMRGQDYFNDILVGGYNYNNYAGQSGTSTTADDHRTTFGSITVNGVVLMLAEQYNNTNTRETFQTWTIFGDASLQVRTERPKALNVAAGNVNGSPYSVTVTSNGAPVANARVALYQNNVSYTALTNAQGVAQVNHQLANGIAKLTVTAYNHGTHQSDVNVGGGGNPVVVPGIPTGLNVSNITQTTATLNWNAVNGATSYKLMFNGNEYDVNGTSTNVTSLAAGTQYTWSVKALNANGSSNYSVSNTFTTLNDVVEPEPQPVGYALPYAESFTANAMPEGWTAQTSSTSIQSNWTLVSTNKAGGAANEMRCRYQNANGTVRLITPAINTEGTNRATLTFKHHFDAYSSNGPTIKVQTSNDLQNWVNTSWSVATDANNIAATTVTIELANSMNSATTYVAFVLEGNLYGFDYWYIDDISLVATAAPVIVVPTVSTLAVSNLATTTATFNGEVIANGNAAVTARGFCIGFTPNPSINNAAVINVGTGTGAFTVNATGMSANTTYYLRAFATNQAGTAYGEQVVFTTLADAAQPLPMPEGYCASKGNSSTHEWISTVQYAGIDNVSASNGGYADNTNQQATVALGETNTLYIRAGFAGTAYTQYWKVWIDYNRDGVFTDDEIVASGSSSSSNLMSVNVTTPANASLGITRMRVSMKFSSSQSACETFNYGEVEDYAVNIVSQRSTRSFVEPFAAQQLTDEAEPMFTLYPNPVADVLNIKANGLQGSIRADIFNAQGTLVRTEYISASQPVNVADLAAGLYFITIHEERMPVTLKFIKR